MNLHLMKKIMILLYLFSKEYIINHKKNSICYCDNPLFMLCKSMDNFKIKTRHLLVVYEFTILDIQFFYT